MSLKIEVNIAGRYKNRDDVEKLFQKYAQRLFKNIQLLSKKYNFKTPKGILLRPMYVKNGDYPYHGRVHHNYFSGYSILMNIETCAHMKDKGIGILDHECAHIINDILHNDFGHGEKFKTMYAACRNSKNRKNNRRDKK